MSGSKIASWTVAALAALIAQLALALPIRAESRSFTFTVDEKHIEFGGGLKYAAWTYNGMVPGPTIEVRQGDDVHIKLINHTRSAHGIDIYGAQIAPQKFLGRLGAPETTYDFTAAIPGVYVYHCSALPVLEHIADGMYGMMIVEPRGGWPGGNAQEVPLVQSEFYGVPDAHGLVVGDARKMNEARPDFVVFNGALDKYDVDHPIRIKVGDLVRIFFVNAGPNLLSTFHVSGVIFSAVYKGGNPDNAFHDISSFEVGPGDGAVMEFRANEPGDYQFSDQAMAHPYRGAIGVFRADK